MYNSCNQQMGGRPDGAGYQMMPLRQPFPPHLLPPVCRFYFSHHPNNEQTHFSIKQRWQEGTSFSEDTKLSPSQEKPEGSSKGVKRPIESKSSSARSESPCMSEQKKGKCEPSDCDAYAALSEEIIDVYMENRQSTKTYSQKKELLDVVQKYAQECLQGLYERVWVFSVGSSENGFGSDSSDVDMCICLPLPAQYSIIHRQEAIDVLRRLMNRLKRVPSFKSLEIIRAKVPILKFRDQSTGIEVDINCNNTVGIRNTHLLKYYSNLDWRVRVLVLVVKLWAQKHNINDAKNKTISSYSLTLMVLHYLQCGTSPSVVPCLQELYSFTFDPCQCVHGLRYNAPLGVSVSTNAQSLGSLFAGFLEYYNKFDFEKYVISVRKGCLFLAEDFRAHYCDGDPSQWKYLSIEEPFNLSNTARAVYDPQAWKFIQDVFADSYGTILSTKSFHALLQDGK